jgi:hypothetical protein
MRTPKHDENSYPESIAWQTAVLVLMVFGAVYTWVERKVRRGDE